MFASYLTKQESVNSQGFLAPYAGLEAPLATPRADAAALCKSARREMRSQMQIAKRFANENQKSIFKWSALMRPLKKLTALAFVALAATAAGSAAQAQTALTNGVSFSTAAPTGSYTSLNLGSTAGNGFVTTMPLSLSYAGVNVNLSFTGSHSGVGASGRLWNPTPGQNHLAINGTATMQFSSAQTSFGAIWSTPDNTNMLQFYNGSQLLASFTGEQYRIATGLPSNNTGAQASFSFSEVSYDRIVMSSSVGGFEIGGITFSDQAVDVAPIPLNAASLGGLISFLMMLGLRGKGGTQVMVRMAFASIMPRRRAMA